jgi:hypothetical protein
MMNMSESLQALRRANPRTKAGFEQLVVAAADAVRTGMDAASMEAVAGADGAGGTEPGRRRSATRRRLAGAFAAVSVAVAVAASLTIGSPGSGLPNAAAAVRKAASTSAASAERSGTAVVRMTHGGKPWTGATISWHDQDLSVSQDAPRRLGRAGSKLRVVDGTLYGIDPVQGGWVKLGSPESIDPDSGTTPDEYLAGVREDIGGITLHRIVDNMTGLITRRLGDGSTVFSGTAPPG